MNIKIPRIKIIRPNSYHIASEVIVAQYLKFCFWASWLVPFGAYKIYEIIIKEIVK